MKAASSTWSMFDLDSPVAALEPVGRDTLALAPAQADPPHWRHGGWHKHHRWGPPPHRYYPPPPHYYGPRGYYAPPPVYYAPPPVYMAPGLSFGFSVPLR